MQKILLHLGLPKTATTTLQHNVFQKLHDMGKVNFLGKCINYNEGSGMVHVINYSGKFIRDAAEEKIPINEARLRLKNVINKELINIFSDEGIMVAYPRMDNLPLKRKISNLKAIFDGYEVKVLLTLRQPVEYFYSLYVQLHPDYYSQVKKLNAFEKYVEHYIQNPDDTLYESFHYKEYLLTKGCG